MVLHGLLAGLSRATGNWGIAPTNSQGTCSGGAEPPPHIGRQSRTKKTIATRSYPAAKTIATRNCRAAKLNLLAVIIYFRPLVLYFQRTMQSSSQQQRFNPGLEIACLLLLLGFFSPNAVASNRQQNPPLFSLTTQEPAKSNAPIIEQLRRAADLLQAGKLDEAESILRRLLATTPNNSDAHNLLGIILNQRNRSAEAEREYRTALRLNPNGVSAMANLGVLLASTNRSAEATKTFEAVLRLVPDHPQATLNLGLQYAARGNDALAVPLLQKAIALQLAGYEVQYRLGISLYNLKHFDEASTAFAAALTVSSQAAGPVYYLGLIAWTNARFDQAEELFSRAVVLQPGFPEANFMLGEGLRRSQKFQAAAESYELALHQEPTKFVYYARLGGVYIKLGQADQAREIFRRGALRFPQLPEAHYFLGIASRALGDYASAEVELRRSLRLQANNVDALAQLGFVLLERDMTAEAENVLRRAIALNDKHFFANSDLGRLLVRTRRYDEAVPVLQAAGKLRPKDPGVHYQLFMALSRLKQKEAADRELAIFKELDEAKKSKRTTDAGIPDDEFVPSPAGQSQPLRTSP
jgi:tetratricopeptide (TPR) repeat protein